MYVHVQYVLYSSMIILILEDTSFILSIYAITLL